MRSADDDMEILGLEPPITAVTVSQAYRRLVIRHHPDLGGDGQAMAHINRARDRLLASLEPPGHPPRGPMRWEAAIPVDEGIDNPSPLTYLVWMVLLPTVLLTVLFVMLWITG